MAEKLIIKKYPNRRLYNPQKSCYITLSDVRDLVVQQVDFGVVDRQSGTDITDSILLQIIMEQETGRDRLFSNNILSQFIRYHNTPLQTDFVGFLEESLETFQRQQTPGQETAK